MIFCVIGIGLHAKNKIIPSLLDIKDIKIVTVSRKNNKLSNIHKHFTSINNCLLYLKNKKKTFIITSPPNTHYKYFLKISKIKNSKIFIEKPITTSSYEINKITEIAKKNKLLISEIYPYKLSRSFKYLNKFYKHNHLKLKSISINFLIPSFPKNSFRNSNLITNSSLFDIGCYPVSLLLDLGFKINDYKIVQFNSNNPFKKYFKINFIENNIKIKIKIGSNLKYTNNVIFTYNTDNAIVFDYFFYNIPIKKNIIFYKKNKKIKTITNSDKNLFTSYFKKKTVNTKLNKSFLIIKKLEEMSFNLNNKM